MTESGTPDESSDEPSEAGREFRSRLDQVPSRQTGGRKRPSRAKRARSTTTAAAAVTSPVEETVHTASEPTPEPIIDSVPVAELAPVPMAEGDAAPVPLPVMPAVPTPLRTDAVPAVKKKPKGERRMEVRMSGSRADGKERQVRREFVMALVATVAAYGAIWVATGALGR